MTDSEYARYVQETRISDRAAGKLTRTKHAIWAQLKGRLEWACFNARCEFDAIRVQGVRGGPAASGLALIAADAQLVGRIEAIHAHRAREADAQADRS